MDITSSNSGDIIQLGDGGGRGYPLGRARAVIKDDGAETNDSYSVSEWWLDPGFAGFATTATTPTMTCSMCSPVR